MDTILSESIGFNPAPPTVMMMDINSCFATIEQQANPLLRGKPVVVGAYTTDRGCILAASREAKKLGVKTGMMVGEGKQLCRNLIVLSPDPDKYRCINKQLVELFEHYTDRITVKSIDEMVGLFSGSVILDRRTKSGISIPDAMIAIAKEIKMRIAEEIGDWLTVSIGIAPNQYLAKIGTGLEKPDGLVLIEKQNIEIMLQRLKLEGLTGIKEGNGTRLRWMGITTPLQFYQADIKTLKSAFHSIVGYHWWLRLHGWEADDRIFSRKSVGHSYALPKPFTPSQDELLQILYQLVMKMGRRLRFDHLSAGGIHVSCSYRDGDYWHHGEKQTQQLFTDTDLYAASCRILKGAPEKGIRILAVSSFELGDTKYIQQDLFSDTKDRSYKITEALDAIADRWGEWTVTPGRLLSMEQKVQDRIAFGGGRSIDFATRGL